MRSILVLLICLLPAASSADDGHDQSSGSVVTGNAQFLPPGQAFCFKVFVLDARTLKASFNVSPGYYLYRDKIRFTIKDDSAKITTVSFPKGEIKKDRTFGQTVVLRNAFQIQISLDRMHTEPARITLNSKYQGCTEQGVCYMPIEKANQLSLPLDQAAAGVHSNLSTSPNPSAAVLSSQSATETTHIANLFKQGNFWLIVTFFFGAGLLLSFTPCVFPMIPILSGIIVGSSKKITHKHALIMSLAFVLGMAITYATAGVVAGFSGTLISSALQTPWVLGTFAGLFVLLSLSMFGFYEIQLPSSWQSKLSEKSNRLVGGHLGGLFLMGALSAIIMGPCVTAPLAGALLYIGQTHDAITGGIALFFLALGMGAPLLLVGTSAGVLLPRAGRWMNEIKRVFGVLLLALAIWIIQPLLPIGTQMLLWALLLILSAAYFQFRNPSRRDDRVWHKLVKGVGISASALLGAAYLIGSLFGARDIMNPLGSLRKVEGQGPTLQFSRITDAVDLDQKLIEAKGKPVMVDFYADWCVSCKEMDRYTFTDPKVESKLKHVLLLQVDVTANSDADKALLKRYGMYGPPGILFFNSEGKEMKDYRVIGYQDSAQFLKSTENTCQVITIC